MSHVTVREIMTLAPLAGTYVLGGSDGLDRAVSGVNVMEVPDIEPYVKAGELLLTTGYPVRERPERLVEMLPELAARGLAGLAVKPLRYLERLPDNLRKTAERLRFPVLVVPDHTSFNEVIGAVLAVVLADYGAEPSRAEAIRERLTGVALSGGGLREIARTLAGALDRPVTVIDEDGVVLGASDATSLDSPTGVDEEARQWRFAISVAGARRGEIVVGGEQEPTLGQRRIIRQSCFAAGMHMAQALASIELDRRLRVLFLEELVTGPRMDEGTLRQRARLLGWHLDGPHAVLVATCDAELGDTAVAQAARSALGPHALAWCRGRAVVAITDVSPAWDRAPERRWQEELTRLGGGAVTVAAGSVVADPAALATSHGAAQEALRVAQLTGQVAVRHENLTLERLILAAPPQQLREFVEQQVGDLVRHDEQTGGDLCRTLEVYLGLGNAAEAARRLYIHYNTLKHRLVRIADLTGADLHDPRARLQLAFALEVRALLGENRAGAQGAHSS